MKDKGQVIIYLPPVQFLGRAKTYNMSSVSGSDLSLRVDGPPTSLETQN